MVGIEVRFKIDGFVIIDQVLKKRIEKIKLLKEFSAEEKKLLIAYFEKGRKELEKEKKRPSSKEARKEIEEYERKEKRYDNELSASKKKTDKIIDEKIKSFKKIGEDKKCPNCQKNLKIIPQKKKKCEYCYKSIYVRTRPSDNKKVLLNEKGKNEIDKQWNKHYELLYETKESEYRKNAHPLIRSKALDELKDWKKDSYSMYEWIYSERCPYSEHAKNNENSFRIDDVVKGRVDFPKNKIECICNAVLYKIEKTAEEREEEEIEYFKKLLYKIKEQKLKR